MKNIPSLIHLPILQSFVCSLKWNPDCSESTSRPSSSRHRAPPCFGGFIPNFLVLDPSPQVTEHSLQSVIICTSQSTGKFMRYIHTYTYISHIPMRWGGEKESWQVDWKICFCSLTIKLLKFKGWCIFVILFTLAHFDTWKFYTERCVNL